MFFSISKQKDSRFSNHKKIGNFFISMDHGWHEEKKSASFFKGYKTPELEHGNWCRVTLTDNGEIFLDHDANRSFPLIWDENTKTLTNMPDKGLKIWADTKVFIDNKTTEIRFERFDPVGTINETPVAPENFNIWVLGNIETKLRSVLNNYKDSEFCCFNSKGVDTSLISALVKKNDFPVTLFDYEHFEKDSFCHKNIEVIKENYWAYKQMHHWEKSCFLLSGACGDEFWFRGPYTISLWAAWHDIDVCKLLTNSKKYNVNYFSLGKNIKIFNDFFRDRKKIKDQYPTYRDLVLQILNINVNDHQHWHLGNTLTWTPYKDIEITKKILYLPFDTLIKQILGSELNFNAIDAVFPEVKKSMFNTKSNY